MALDRDWKLKHKQSYNITKEQKASFFSGHKYVVCLFLYGFVGRSECSVYMLHYFTWNVYELTVQQQICI